MKVIKTKFGDIKTPTQIEQLLMNYDVDEIIEDLTLSQITNIYNLYNIQEDRMNVAVVILAGALSDNQIKQDIIESLKEVISWKGEK